MGYYTAYTINYTIPEGENGENFSHKLARGLSAINNDFYYSANCTIEDMIENDIMKWYDHTEDMIELSKLFPTVVFTLDGHGEDRDDIWREYYFNGKNQFVQAKIVFDPIDEIRLGIIERKEN